MADAPSARPWVGRIALAIGGAGAVELVAWAGAGTVATAALAAGWTLPPLLLLHALQLGVSALAWRDVTGAGAGHGWRWARIRWIREAVNSLLPVAQIGGVLVGIRLLRRGGVPLARGAAGTTLDMTVEAVTQFLFTLLGVAVLAASGAGGAWRPLVFGLVGVTGVGVAGFVVAQQAGALRLVEWLAERMSGWMPALPAEDMRGMHAHLVTLRARRGALLRAGLWHASAWLLGVGETWLVLAAIGAPHGAAAAIVVESLGMAARSAGFAVPGALGVQEGGFLLAGSLVGIPADAAIALSLVKRARELLVGVPGLLAWQWAELAPPLPASRIAALLD